MPSGRAVLQKMNNNFRNELKYMENYRIFVEKYAEFGVEAESLRCELNENLGLNIRSLRLLNVYDLFGFTPELLEPQPLFGVRRGGNRPRERPIARSTA